MILTYKDFVAHSEGKHFNLYEKRDSKSKDEKTGKVITKKKEMLIGYSYTYESLIDTIIRLQIAKNEKTHHLSEYLTMYRKEKEEIFNLLKQK